MRTEPFDVDNYVRVFFTSHHPTPVHIELTDRRFVPIEVSAHANTNNLEYFRLDLSKSRPWKTSWQTIPTQSGSTRRGRTQGKNALRGHGHGSGGSVSPGFQQLRALRGLVHYRPAGEGTAAQGTDEAYAHRLARTAPGPLVRQHSMDEISDGGTSPARLRRHQAGEASLEAARTILTRLRLAFFSSAIFRPNPICLANSDRRAA